MPVSDALYPVNLLLSGRKCLVVGGGSVAARKVSGLVAAGAEVLVVATSVGAEIRAIGVTFEERPYRRGEVAGYRLVMAATDDPEVNRAVHDDGETAGVWVNAADDPPACSFILPAVIRQGPITVTVSTSGYSPALATWLKAHVSEQLGPEYAVLARLLSAARDELKASGRSTEDVDWRPALDWDMLALLRAGNTALAKERLQACLSSSLD